MSVLFAGQPCLDPDALTADCLRAGISVVTWRGRANSFRCPRGVSPGEGYLLLSRQSLQQISADLTFSDRYDLVFRSDEYGQTPQTVTIKKLAVVATECVTPAERGGNAAYLVVVRDVRDMMRGHRFSKSYNVRDSKKADSPYLAATLNNGTPWTWQTLWEDLWSLSGMPYTAPTWPTDYVPQGEPGAFVWRDALITDAITEVLARSGCELAWVPQSDQFFIVAVGAEDSPLQQALDAVDDRRHWDTYPLRSQRQLPASIHVHFPVLPTGDVQTYTTEVVSNPYGGGEGVYGLIDDMPAIFGYAWQLRHRAVARAYARFRVMSALSHLQRIVLPYAVSDLRLMPGPGVAEVMFRELGQQQIPYSGCATEIVLSIAATPTSTTTTTTTSPDPTTTTTTSTTTTTTTTAAQPCLSTCWRRWNAATKVWNIWSGCQSPICHCAYPNICGTVDGEFKEVPCRATADIPPCCGQDLPTTTTTTAACFLAQGCLWIFDGFFKNWKLKINNCVSPCICSSPVYNPETPPCTEAWTDCHPVMQDPPPPPCEGSCYWVILFDSNVYPPRYRWGGPYYHDRRTCYSYRPCCSTKVGCICDPPNLDPQLADPCLVYQTYCYDYTSDQPCKPTTTTTSTTTTTTTTPCNGTRMCGWIWLVSSWNGFADWFAEPIMGNCQSPCSVCCKPTFPGSAHNEILVVPCQSDGYVCPTTTSTTTTTTSTTTTTTTTPCDVTRVCEFQWSPGFASWTLLNHNCTEPCLVCCEPPFTGTFGQLVLTYCQPTGHVCPTTTTTTMSPGTSTPPPP